MFWRPFSLPVTICYEVHDWVTIAVALHDPQTPSSDDVPNAYFLFGAAGDHPEVLECSAENAPKSYTKQQLVLLEDITMLTYKT